MDRSSARAADAIDATAAGGGRHVILQVAADLVDGKLRLTPAVGAARGRMAWVRHDHAIRVGRTRRARGARGRTVALQVLLAEARGHDEADREHAEARPEKCHAFKVNATGLRSKRQLGHTWSHDGDTAWLVRGGARFPQSAGELRCPELAHRVLIQDARQEVLEGSCRVIRPRAPKTARLLHDDRRRVRPRGHRKGQALVGGCRHRDASLAPRPCGSRATRLAR